MKKINFALGKASGTAIGEVDANSTSSSGAGGLSSFAGLVLSTRGPVNRVIRVTADNFESVLGTPLHPRSGQSFEPYRHVQTAVLGGAGYLVRVPATGMMVPAISLSVGVAADGKTSTIVATNSAFAAGSTPVLPDGAFALFYVDDGDASKDRTFSLEADSLTAGLYNLTLNQVASDGSITTLETQQVSFDTNATTDMGETAYATSALENNNSRLRVLLSNDALAKSLKAALSIKSLAFFGGTDGDFTKVTTADYSKALGVLIKSQANFTAILSLGCYDATTIIALQTLAANCRVDMFYDLKGAQTADAAIKEAKSHNLGGEHMACRYYFPYSAKDSYSGMSVVYGISCDAFVAKSKGIALVNDVGGYHYAPAGVSRASLNRTNIAVLPNLDEIDLEAMYDARINTVAISGDGTVFIDDSLTTYGKNNYLRFQHISSLMNAIGRNFYDIATELKHEPDGITQAGLTDAISDLLGRFYAAGALVTPRDTSQGKEPFVVSVTQLDIDEWQVTWQVCPTGVSRRILGKPILMR